jgi:nitrogen fixation NifU-like protein
LGSFSCGSAIASSSLATEWIKVCLRLPKLSFADHFCRILTAIPQGKTIDEAAGLKNTDIAKHLNLPPVKLHCSMLAEDAIKVMFAEVHPSCSLALHQ